jgi:hypothetical protein
MNSTEYNNQARELYKTLAIPESNFGKGTAYVLAIANFFAEAGLIELDGDSEKELAIDLVKKVTPLIEAIPKSSSQHRQRFEAKSGGKLATNILESLQEI